MVTKYQMISCLAEDTAKEIAKNGQEWTRYLTTAARLYKYPFNEQILIFAQRPDATACASIEIWNEKMNCWVNRGAKGIALLDTENSYTRLKYVFDVSDVHKARRIGRDPNLWELREEHKETVLAQLEKTYGETDKNSSFEQRIMEISNRIAFDYYEELLSEIEYVKEGSFLEELDELNVGVRIRDTLSSSIAYTILSRCGADMELWKDELGFEYISDFNTMKTLSVVGTATTDMCKPLLMEIGRTVGAYDRQIARKKAQEKANAGRTQTSLEYTEKVLANESDTDYNALKRESEKKLQNNQEIEIQSKKEDAAYETDIRKERGLSDSEPDSERGAGGDADEVRSDAKEFLTGTPERDLSGHDTDGRAESTLSGDTGAGRAENGSPERADGESRGSERGTESSRSDEVGSEDEQHQAFSGGDRADGADLQLENDIQEDDIQEEEIPEPDSGEYSLSGSFFPKLSEIEHGEDLQRGILCSDEFLKHKRPEIAGYFQIEQDAKIQADYLRNSFRMEEYTEFNIGEMRGGYRADEDGITLWKGNYLTREAESRLSWEEARFFVNSYMEDGVYLLPGETAEQIETAGMYQQLDLFSMFTEQAGNLAMKQAETVTPIRSVAKIPPEQIADILRSGGGRDNSRKRIYTKYQQRKTPEEMAAFLQKEYGTTGKGFEFDGKQIAVWFNEDGMRVGYGTSTERPVLQMNWQEIEAEIRSQVVSGTYMGANEAYLSDEAERDRIAGHLFFFFRDGMEEIPEELELKAGNYPDAHAHMVELLSTKEGVEMVASHMDHALHQLETGEKKLRFRSIISKDELRAELDNLLIEKQIFPTADHVEIKREDFITQDEIDNRLGRGSGFSHGSFRIYDYFKEGHDSKEAETFLKKEYGIGGSSHALAGADHSWEDHNFKGIELKKGNICEPYAKVMLSWKVVEKRIRKLVAEDKYLSPEGKEAYARYKEEEAQKALEEAQAVIERKTKVACKEAIEQTISEKFDGYRLPKDTPDEVLRKYGSERVSYVLANTVMHLTHDGRFSPDNKAWAKEIEPYAMWENRDLIVSSHPAVLNGFINQTRRYMEQEFAAKQITIDGQLCMKVDEWEADGAAFLMGNFVEDKNFFYASVNGNYHYEYDYMPDREEVEDDYINSVAMEDIDRHEAEVFSRIEGTEDVAETESRFSVEETSDAIEPGQDTSGHDVQKSEAESAIEKPVKQPAPKVDKSNAVNFHITDDALGAGSAKEKFRRNIEAIRTLEKVESENRIATLEEQQILSQYVGWGGLADAFDESKSAWAGEYQQLKELLSPQEYASARESTLNAHYTSPAIIRSIYDTLERMGFEKGNVLEPAMGIGNFFGMLPEKMQESRLYGVELDGITGRIARQLYPKADIKISGFEKTDYPNDFFDVAVGNVPFGQYKVADKQYDKNNFLIHDYFFGATRS